VSYLKGPMAREEVHPAPTDTLKAWCPLVGEWAARGERIPAYRKGSQATALARGQVI
jgi:hypothetical protein